jgi:hypothetical protein
LTATVTEIVHRSKSGPYAIAAPEPEQGLKGSITFSLLSRVWREKRKVRKGDKVVLDALVRKQAGWLARNARFFTPADEREQTAKKGRWKMSKSSPVKIIAHNKEVDFDSVKVTFFVRQNLSHERVKHFVDLYQSPQAGGVPNIQITPDGQLVEGRHRYHAKKELNAKKLTVDIVDGTKSELLAKALTDDCGGAMPPTPADVVFTIAQLIRNKMPQVTIMERLSTVYPKSVCRKYIELAYTKVRQQNIKKAAADVGKNVPLSVAAEKHGVTVAELKKELGIKKNPGDEESLFSVRAEKAGLSTRYRSNSQKNAKLLSKICNGVIDGDLTEKDANEAIAELARLLNSHVNAYHEGINRVAVAMREHGMTPKIEVAGFYAGAHEESQKDAVAPEVPKGSRKRRRRNKKG